MAGGDVLTTGQAAKACGVSIRTLKRWLDRGEMVGYRLPGSGEWRIRRQDLVSFMDRHGIPLGPLAVEAARRILVVVGDEATLEFIHNALSPDERLQTQAAATGCEACLKAGLLRPHVVLIDLTIPYVDGFEVARAIRGDAATRQARIVFVTARRDPQMVARMNSLGQAYLVKPIQLEPLLEAVYRMLWLARPAASPTGG